MVPNNTMTLAFMTQYQNTHTLLTDAIRKTDTLYLSLFFPYRNISENRLAYLPNRCFHLFTSRARFALDYASLVTLPYSKN